MITWKTITHVALVSAAFLASPGAFAQPLQKVRIAALGGGLWSASQPGFCAERGEFKKAGLEVDVLQTRGGSETVQAIIAGGADIAYGVSLGAVLAAQMQGANIKTISSYYSGNSDTFYYVRTDSPIKSISDINGATVAYGRPASVSEILARALKSELNYDVKPVAGGNVDAIFTMTMTRQIDIGMSNPPSGMAAIRNGDIRIIFDGDVVTRQRNVVNRVNAATADFVKNRRDVGIKFLTTLQGCIDWMYENKSEAAKMYGKLNQVDDDIATRALALYPREKLEYGPLTGLDVVITDSIRDKFIPSRPTDDQLKTFVDLIYQRPGLAK